MSITVEVESEFLPKRKNAHDLYVPILYKYGSDSKDSGSRHARHLDIVKTWKDLEYCHAEELYFWEIATRAALESCLEEKLISLLVASEKDLADLPAIDTLYRTQDFVNKLGQRRLEFPLSTLTRFMADYHSAYGPHFKWLMNIPDVDVVLGNYLRTFDFFRQDDLGICIVDLDLVAYILDNGRVWSDDTQSAHSLRVIGTCRNQPHQLNFAVQSMTVIHPWFKEPVLDLNVPVFNAAVVVHDEGQRTCVTVNKYFPGNVRLERMIRLDLSEHIDRSRLDPATAADTFSPCIPRTRSNIEDQKYEHKEPVVRNKKRPLRTISTGSARVQGFGSSAFEQAAKYKHRKLYEVHAENRRENLRHSAAVCDEEAPRPPGRLPRHRLSVDDISRAASSVYVPPSSNASMYKIDVSSSSSVSPPDARPSNIGLISAVPRGTPRGRYNAHREEHSRALANPLSATTQVRISSIQLDSPPRHQKITHPTRFYPTWDQALHAEIGSNGKSAHTKAETECLNACNHSQFLTQLDNFPKIGMHNVSRLTPPPDIFNRRRQEQIDHEQAKIKRNYQEFEKKSPRTLTRLEQEESHSIEKAFLRARDLDSDGESTPDDTLLCTSTESEAFIFRNKPRSNRTPLLTSYDTRAAPTFGSQDSSARRLKHTTSFRTLRSLDKKREILHESSERRLNASSRSKHCLSSPTLRKGRPLTRDDAAIRKQEDDLSEFEEHELALADLQVIDLSRQPAEYGDYDDALEPEWYD